MHFWFVNFKPRANWHKYNGGEYFVTICTKDRIHYFGEIADGKIHLTDIGEYLKTQIENTETIRGGDVTIPLYTIMPNHIHLIVVLHYSNNPSRSICRDTPRVSDNHVRMKQPDDIARTDAVQRTDAVRPYGCNFGIQTKNLGSVIRGIKSAVTRYANGNNIPFAWQERYNDHIIRNQLEMNRIADYIENNPLIWHRDRNNP